MTADDPDGAATPRAVPLPEALALAVAHHQAGRLAEAEAIYRRILAVRPDHAGALHRLGLIDRSAGRHALAAERIGRAVALDPSSADAHYNLGNALRDLGRLDAAAASYRRAIVLRPDLAAAHGNLALLDLDRDRREDAIAGFRRALAIRPDYPEALGNLGMALQKDGDLDGATAALRHALRLRPDHAVAWSNLGCALQDQGRWEEAAEAFRRAIALEPGFPGAHANLGALFRAQERFAEAAAASNRALTLRPDDGAIWRNHAIALLNLGRLDEAGAALARAADRAPPTDAVTVQSVAALRRFCPPAEVLSTRRFDGATGVIRLESARVCNNEWHVVHDGRLYPDLVFHLAPDRRFDSAWLLANGQGLLARGLVVQSEDAPVVLLGGCRNYYHWLFDHLPRLRLIAAAPDLDGLPIVVNSDLADYQRDSLDALGIGPDRRRGYAGAEVIACRTLYVPHVAGRSFAATGVPEWWQPTVTPDTVAWLRAALGRPHPARPGRRLFVSRGDAATRRCLNEAEIEAIAARQGYEVVRPGTLTLAAQAALFAEAERVAGIHGAGFANLVFAPPGGTVIEFLGDHRPPTFYRHLAALCGQSYHGIAVPVAARASGVNDPRFHHIRIDPALAARVLAQ